MVINTYNEDSYKKCLIKLEKGMINRGLGTPFNYCKKIKKNYPFVNIESLLPPFKTDIEEPQIFMHDHISVIIPEKLTVPYKRLFSFYDEIDTPTIEKLIESRRRDEVSIRGIKKYEFELNHRYVENEKHNTLEEIIMMSDGASIIYKSKKTKKDASKYGLFRFRGNIEPAKGTAIRKLINRMENYGAELPKRRTKDFEKLRGKLGRKVYELIAWSWIGGGTKHRAAGRLAIISQSKNLTIDILSKSGVYSRVSVDEDLKILTKNISIQPIKNFKSLPQKEYLFGKEQKHVIYSIEYKENTNTSLDSCWVSVTGDYFLHPKHPSEEKVKAHHLEGLGSFKK